MIVHPKFKTFSLLLSLALIKAKILTIKFLATTRVIYLLSFCPPRTLLGRPAIGKGRNRVKVCTKVVDSQHNCWKTTQISGWIVPSPWRKASYLLLSYPVFWHLALFSCLNSKKSWLLTFLRILFVFYLTGFSKVTHFISLDLKLTILFCVVFTSSCLTSSHHQMEEWLKRYRELIPIPNRFRFRGFSQLQL